VTVGDRASGFMSLFRATNLCFVFIEATFALTVCIAVKFLIYTIIKALVMLPTYAHRYKITGILKQLKFRQLLRHVSVHVGTIIRELFRALLKLQLKLQL
jgi:hypothetical protein